MQPLAFSIPIQCWFPNEIMIHSIFKLNDDGDDDDDISTSCVHRHQIFDGVERAYDNNLRYHVIGIFWHRLHIKINGFEGGLQEIESFLSHSLSRSFRFSPGSSSLQCLAFCVDVRPTKTSKCEFYRMLLAWTGCQLNSSFRKIGNAHQIKTVSYAASECSGSGNWFVVRLCHATEWEQNNNNRRRCEFSEYSAWQCTSEARRVDARQGEWERERREMPYL